MVPGASGLHFQNHSYILHAQQAAATAHSSLFPQWLFMVTALSCLNLLCDVWRAIISLTVPSAPYREPHHSLFFPQLKALVRQLLLSLHPRGDY